MEWRCFRSRKEQGLGPVEIGWVRTADNAPVEEIIEKAEMQFGNDDGSLIIRF